MNSEPPASILIIGSGVFGLSTAWALSKRGHFANTVITVVDDAKGQFPPPDAASIDSSRVVRSDYAEPLLAELASSAQHEWRKLADDELGGLGRYCQSGLLVMAEEPTEIEPDKMTAMNYVKASWENVSRIVEQRDTLRLLDSPQALQSYLGTQQPPGHWGYLNRLSGWANAERSMAWLFDQVNATGAINFIDAVVKKLTTNGGKVTGAKLSDDTVLEADVVIVAAGAWTGSLVDLRGRTEASAQALAYIELSNDEFAVLSKQPVVVHLTSGIYIIPPQDRTLKVARTSHGYLNPTTVGSALPLSPNLEPQPTTTSQPLTARNGSTGQLPQDSEAVLRWALATLLPISGLEKRPWKKTRLCWYSDTVDGEWLVDWHPGWEGLFVATGDSGHAFKFLPVLGEKVADCFLGKGGELGEKWKWRESQDETAGKEINGYYHGLVTADGSRGGKPGAILKDSLSVK